MVGYFEGTYVGWALLCVYMFLSCFFIGDCVVFIVYCCLIGVRKLPYQDIIFMYSLKVLCMQVRLYFAWS